MREGGGDKDRERETEAEKVSSKTHFIEKLKIINASAGENLEK